MGNSPEHLPQVAQAAKFGVASPAGGLSASPGVRPGEDLLDFNEPKDAAL